MVRVKRIAALAVCSLMAIQLSACSNMQEISEYRMPEAMETVATGLVAQNDAYLLKWNDEQKCVLLEDKTSGHIWSTVPYEYFLQDKSNVNLNSPLFIEYYSPFDGSLQTSKAYPDCIQEDALSVTTIDNGLKLEFHFQNAEITIPLYITLRDDSLVASIPLSEIYETGATRLVSVSMLPYFCSTPNANDKDSYLMIPVGSGALMYTDEEIQSNSRSFSGKVYGSDRTAVVLDNFADEQRILLPVYGVKSREYALFSIIEGGAGSARIDAEAGNSRNGHSAVYSTFQVRGYDIVEAARNKYSDELIYTKHFDPNIVYSVAYYPLEGSDASYVGMSRCYQRYMQNAQSLIKSDEPQQPYLIELLGGSMAKHFTLGVPYQALQATTTFAQAKTILEDITSATGQLPSVVLSGFGKTGLTPGQVAGGYTFASALGGKKGHATLEEYCRQAGIPLSTDFDLVRYRSSGNGYFQLFDTAKTASMQPATYYPLKTNVRTQDKGLMKIRLLKRGRLEKAVDKLMRFAKGRVSGISLSTLGSLAYSDYTDEQYYMKGSLSRQIAPIMKTVRTEGHKLYLSEANDYAAGMADVLYHVPLQNGGYVTLDETIPFYEMVFGEYAALYSEAINLSPDLNSMLLRSVEAGVSPSFTLCAMYDGKLADAAESDYYGELFSSVKKDIVALLAKTAPYFEKVGGQWIVDHQIIDENVAKTTFSGGTVVWTNHGKQTVIIDGVPLEAGTFRYTE